MKVKVDIYTYAFNFLPQKVSLLILLSEEQNLDIRKNIVREKM